MHVAVRALYTFELRSDWLAASIVKQWSCPEQQQLSVQRTICNRGQLALQIGLAQ